MNTLQISMLEHLDYTPSLPNPAHNADRTLPVTMFPTNANLLIPRDMEDNPNYSTTEYFIQVKLEYLT